MIPVALPSPGFVLILLGFLIGTLVWLVWTLCLALSARARRRLRGKRALAYALFAVIGGVTLWTAFDFRRDLAAYRAQQDADFRAVLDRDQHIGGIDMPAGTVLKLAIPRQRDAFDRAEFPHAVPVAGVMALTAERYLSIQTDAEYRTTGFAPMSIRLTGVGESRVQGWLCDARQLVTFATTDDGSIADFRSCTAAAGNRIGDSLVPQGAMIVATEGTHYPGGRVDPDRWLIHLPADGELRLGDTVQKGGAVLLDAQRRIFRLVPP